MVQDLINDRHFTADEGKTFVRKEDSVRCGFDLYLAEIDTIEAYQEEDMTEEEKAAKAELEKKPETVEKKKH